MARTKTKGGTAVVVLVSILCCILTFILTLLLITSLTTYRVVEQGTLVTAVENLDLTDIELKTDGKTITLAELIVEEFIDPDEEADPRDIEKVLEDKEITKFAAGIVEDYNVYLRDGGKFPKLQAEAFIDLMEKMEDDIYKDTGLRFGNGDVEALEDDLDDTLDDVNESLELVMGQGVSGFGVRAACSIWMPIAVGVLLLLILLWMILIHVFKGFCAGTALKTFSITAFIACTLLLVGGLMSSAALGWADAGFLNGLLAPVSTQLLLHSGIGIAVCVVLFAIGLLLCRLLPNGTVPVNETTYDPADNGYTAADAYAAPPVAQPEAAPEPVHEAPKRKFCRNCGKELVNPNAKFCYHCGNVQEHVES